MCFKKWFPQLSCFFFQPLHSENTDNDRFYEGSLFPKLSETFGKFRNHSVTLIILHSIWAQKYHITENYLKWHSWTETICNNYIFKRPIAEAFRNFRNVSESFENHNSSWKRPMFWNLVHLLLTYSFTTYVTPLWVFKNVGVNMH